MNRRYRLLPMLLVLPFAACGGSTKAPAANGEAEPQRIAEPEPEPYDVHAAMAREREAWLALKEECDGYYDRIEREDHLRRRELEVALGLAIDYNQPEPREPQAPEDQLPEALAACGARQTDWYARPGNRIEVRFDFHGDYSVGCIFEAVTDADRLMRLEEALFTMTGARGKGRLTIVLATVELGEVDWGVEPVDVPRNASDQLRNELHFHRVFSARIQSRCRRYKEYQHFMATAPQVIDRFQAWRERARASAALLAALERPDIALVELAFADGRLALDLAAPTYPDQREVEAIETAGGFAREIRWAPIDGYRIWPIDEGDLEWIAPESREDEGDAQLWAADVDADALLVALGRSRRPFVVRAGQPMPATGRLRAASREQANDLIEEHYFKYDKQRYPEIRGAGRHIDLAFCRADARRVLWLLADFGKTTISLPAGDDRISMLASDVPWSGAADAIAAALGLERKTRGNRKIRYEPVGKRPGREPEYVTLGGGRDANPAPPPLTWEQLTGARLAAILQHDEYDYYVWLELADGSLVGAASRRHIIPGNPIRIVEVAGTRAVVELKAEREYYRFEFLLTPQER